MTRCKLVCVEWSFRYADWSGVKKMFFKIINKLRSRWLLHHFCYVSNDRHYLNQCWNIVNWTLGNKLQWNLNWNWYIFIQDNAFENVICEMASILSRPQCVNTGVTLASFQFSGKNPLEVNHLWYTIRISNMLNSNLDKLSIESKNVHASLIRERYKKL